MNDTLTKTYAPVSITVYNRKDHLRACIEALLANPDGRLTVVYIFSDAPQPGDEESVVQVRSYIQSISGFGELRAIFQPTNSYETNITQAREIPLRDFGRMIRMEDDIVVSPAFLGFMNEALERFEGDTRVFAISGYTHDFGQLADGGTFLSRDFSAWGYATWSDRGLPEVIRRTDYYSQLRQRPDLLRRIKKLHPFMASMLKLIEQGKLNPSDYKACAHQFLFDKFSVKPTISLVRNTGFDGSGMGGSGANTDIFDTSLSMSSPEIQTDIVYDERVDDAYFHSIFCHNRVANAKTALKLHVSGFLSYGTYLALKRLRKSLLGTNR